MNSNIKILISYKNLHKIVKSDILQPIQTGRAISNEIFTEMLGDDTGDNISNKNNEYAELTAQYWAWKNFDKLGCPEYIGFMHYRRHFIFNETYKQKKEDKCLKYGYSAYAFDKINAAYCDEIGLNDFNIENTVHKYDLIFVQKSNSHYLGCKNGKDDFLKHTFGSSEKYDDLCMKIVVELFPDYKSAVDKLNKGPYRHFYNMFIMKKDLFFRYNQFLFTVLEKFEKSINTTYYSQTAKRVCGYMGEFLLTLFAFKLEEEKKLKIGYLYTSFIKNTEYIKNEQLEPIWKDNYAVIAMSSSDEYVPYLSVCLKSLKANSKKERNYDIIIFSRNITQKNKEILKYSIESNNISLRFVNPMYILEQYPDLKFPTKYNLECYFRLTAPLILNKYDKVIFTDVDLVFENDIYDLYTEKFEEGIAACQDLIYHAHCNIPQLKVHEYAVNELKLINPFKYFNTGVMILNIKYLNENSIPEKLLAMANKKMYRTLEQDVLNKYFQENIHYIDKRWNFPTIHAEHENLIVKAMPLESYNEYKLLRKNPFIIHWAGHFKPWDNTNEDLGYIWWQYARQTPYYELLLQKIINQKFNVIKFALGYRTNILNYWRYKLLSNITFGNTKKHYKNKKNIWKNKIKIGKQLRGE